MKMLVSKQASDKVLQQVDVASDIILKVRQRMRAKLVWNDSLGGIHENKEAVLKVLGILFKTHNKLVDVLKGFQRFTKPAVSDAIEKAWRKSNGRMLDLNPQQRKDEPAYRLVDAAIVALEELRNFARDIARENG